MSGFFCRDGGSRPPFPPPWGRGVRGHPRIPLTAPTPPPKLLVTGGQCSFGFKLPFVKAFAERLLRALDFIHRHGISHNDMYYHGQAHPCVWMATQPCQ